VKSKKVKLNKESQNKEKKALILLINSKILEVLENNLNSLNNNNNLHNKKVKISLHQK
jgi:hypothetical protein